MIAGVDRRVLRIAVLLLGVLIAGVVQLARSPRETQDPAAPPKSGERSESPASSVLEEAFGARRSSVDVSCAGRVTRVLSDDDDGTPHQRFVVRAGERRTVLVAHNLDLAARVPLAVGDSVEIRGVYEWNEEGGVVHWTHDDPDGRREGGWVRHEGETYR